MAPQERRGFSLDKIYPFSCYGSVSEYLDPFEEIQKHGAKLPHWQQSESMQFVTFRLGDAMPANKIRQWKEERSIWVAHHPEPRLPQDETEYHRRFTTILEHLSSDNYKSPQRQSRFYFLLV